MRYPSCEKQAGSSGGKVKRVLVRIKTNMQKIPAMVNRHDDHYKSSYEVNRLDTVRGAYFHFVG